MGWWDINDDGHLDGYEMDRYLLDNGLMPGQPDGYWYEGDDDDPLVLGSSSDGSGNDGSDHGAWSGDDFGGLGNYVGDSDYGTGANWGGGDSDPDDDDDDDSSKSASCGGSSRGKGARRGKKSCYNCLYWCDTYDNWSREDGCRIFDSCVRRNLPDMDGYARPSQDGKTCKEFRPRLEGRTLGCLECRHFRLYDLEYQRSTIAADFPRFCDIKGQVVDVAGIAQYEDREFGLWFTAICPRFELEDSRLSNEPETTKRAWSVKSWKPSGQS